MFSDPFDDQTRWSVSDGEAGQVAYTDGSLSIILAGEDALLLSSRSVPEPVPVLRIEVSMTLSSGDGSAGIGCGTGGDTPDHLVGEVTSQNTWRLSTVVNGVRSSFAEGPLPSALDLSGGGTSVLAVECAATGTDAGDRIALWLGDQVIADAQSGTTLGAWDRATVLATASSPPLVAFFDDAVVAVGSQYAPMEADPAVLELLGHVPAAWRGSCTARRPVGAEALVAGLVCSPAGSAIQAEYYRYSSTAALDGAFQQRLVQARGQVLDQDDCSVGPSLLGWSTPDGSGGRMACFENRDTLGGLQILWTDTRLGILALGVHTDGGFDVLHTWWLDAGPE